MKQKKKIVTPNKKAANKSNPAKFHQKNSKTFIIITGILLISLFTIVFFSSQQQNLTGDAATQPTSYGTIGDCNANHDCPTSGQNNGTASQVTSAINPCTSAKTTTLNSTQGQSKNKGALQLLLQFIQLLLQLIQQLFGGGNVTVPNNPQPTIGVQPSQGAQPSTAPTSATGPTVTPCPTTSAPINQPTVGTPTTTVTTAPVSTTMTPLGIPGTWKLIFDDEFNGTSLDTTKWAPYWFTNGATQNGTVMQSSNVSVSGGYLNLAVTGNTGAIISSNPTAGGHFQFTYGAMEARINIPASGTQIANWPAWWTDGQVWPMDGEIDVIEGLHGNACYHFPPANNQGGCPGGTFTGWHTFGANWQPGIVTYYYDGKSVGTISSGITSAPMYLILENSTGSSSGPKVTPATMQVDYVRVWQ